MHRLTTNVEEQIIVKAIQEEVTWENLPKRLKLFLSSKDDWHRKIKDYCIKKRLKWSECHARSACKETEYYEDLIRYLRKNLALFPYHLSENICRIMRISPFRYYCDMLHEVMKNEKPYDSIPNFSAADALRLTGIGRNEFIDIMNKCRGKRLMWKVNKSIVKEMLPTTPVDFTIEPWWTVCVVNLTLEEYRKLSEDELVVIDKICKDEINLHGEFDPKIVRSLFRKGLVYFDVPVFPDDRVQVSNLEGFVSNREQSYEDPIEEILYAVFVASSESSTISDLATTLQINLDQLESAVSVACRLGWANKILDPSALLNDINQPGSPTSEGSGAEDTSALTSPGSQSPLHEQASDLQGVGEVTRSRPVRVAFLVDANLNSYLMMGSFSPGLKGHAVTLYEAGKLGDSSVADLCGELKNLESTKLEGELQQFVDHALSFCYALECLRSGGTNDSEEPGLKISNAEFDTGFQEFESECSFPNGSSNQEQEGAEGVDSKTSRLSSCSNSADTTVVLGKARYKKARKYRVDVLRSESLASLASGTLQRVFQRDYNFVVSMIPLASPPLVASNDAAGPVHFGPPSRAAMTPWMKLLLYSVFESGPVSVVLLRGLRLRLLPPPLAGCSKALLWTWDGNTFGGIGGKLEGTVVPGGVLLHCLNSTLRHSAVLVQPFPKEDDSLSTVDIPLPLREGSFDCLTHCGEVKLQCYRASAEELSLRTVGYIRFLRVHKFWDAPSDESAWDWVPQTVEFGIPLSDTKLCKGVCEGAVSSELFHSNSLSKHHEAMQRLKKKLHDFITDYQANGPVSRLVYTGEKLEAGTPRLTSNLSLSRWNPFPDNSSDLESPTSKAYIEPQKNRRRRSEMLSFDGDALRSFSLAPIDQSRFAGLPTSSHGLKVDPLDDVEVGEVPLPGVNLLFDGTCLVPLDIGPCLQGRLASSLVAEAAVISATHDPSVFQAMRNDDRRQVLLCKLEECINTQRNILKELKDLEGNRNDDESVQDHEQPPSIFLCPISMELMRDPVVLEATGHTFDRSCILRWFGSSSNSFRCPMTNQTINEVRLVPNLVLRSPIMEWCQQHGTTLEPLGDETTRYIHGLARKIHQAAVLLEIQQLITSDPAKTAESLVEANGIELLVGLLMNGARNPITARVILDVLRYMCVTRGHKMLFRAFNGVSAIMRVLQQEDNLETREAALDLLRQLWYNTKNVEHNEGQAMLPYICKYFQDASSVWKSSGPVSDLLLAILPQPGLRERFIAYERERQNLQQSSDKSSCSMQVET